MKAQNGFTLIELMITVLIVGILAAVAYPNYTEYVLRGNRAEGIALLNDATARQERFMNQNSRYATTLAELRLSANSDNNLYRLSIPANANAAEFNLAVQPINSQARDTGCGTLSLNHLGVRGVSGSKPVNDCWR